MSLRALVSGPLLMLLAAGNAQAQGRSAANPELRRAIATFNGSVAEGEVAVSRVLRTGQLAYGDSAIAYAYLAVAARAGRRIEESETLFSMAMALDPDLQLSADDHAASVRRAFGTLRARLPVVAAVEVPSADFNPFQGGGPAIGYRLENPRREQRAVVKATLESGGQEVYPLTPEVLEGAPLVWSPSPANGLPQSGNYLLKVSARDTRTGITFARRVGVGIRVEAPYGTALEAEPAAPSYESETRTIQIPASGPNVVGALFWGGVAAWAYSEGDKAVRECNARSDPYSDSYSGGSENCGDAATWHNVGGAVAALVAIASLTQSEEGGSREVRDEDAIARNRERRRRYDLDVGVVRDRNNRVMGSVRISIRPLR